MNYDIERYNELKQIIEQREFYKIGEFRDYPIIKNSDLKDKLLSVYLSPDYISDEEENELVIEMLSAIIGTDIQENKQFVFRVVQNEISNGNFSSYDYISDYLSKDQLEQLMNIFLEKIKEPDYQIKNLPDELKTNQKFINYCLENKNLSILNFIEYKAEYLEKAQELIHEGYGFTFLNDIDDSYKSLLMQPLLEAGYIENLNFCSDYSTNVNFLEKNFLEKQKEEFNQRVAIVKEHIKNGKKYTMDHNANLLSLRNDPELINLLIETNQLDFINVTAVEALSQSQIEKFIEKIYNGYQFKEINVLITNSQVLKALLETNQLKSLDMIGKDAFNDNINLIKTRLKEGDFFKLGTLDLENTWLDFIKTDPELLKLLMENNLESLLVIMNYINHHEELLSMYNEEFYQITKSTLAKHYQLNLEHLDQFVNRFGTLYLYYIENTNIRNAINLDEENFNKYMNLFSYDSLNLTNAENIFDSILQARFKKEHEIDINRLTRIKHSLTETNLPLPLEDLTVLASKIDINTIRKLQLLTEEELEQLNQNPLNYLINTYNKIKNKEDIDRNLTIIYEINRQYLRKKREEYRAEHHYEEELDLYYTYDENSLLNILMSDLIKSLSEDTKIMSVFELYNSIELYHLENLNSLANSTEENKEKVKECLLFLKSKGQEYNTKETRQNLNKLKDILRYMIKDEEISLEIKTTVKINEEDYNVKKIYYVPQDNSQIFSILQEINSQELKDTVFNNEEVYQELNHLLQKYKFTNWQDIFKNSLKKSNLSLESYDIAALISKFNELYKHMERKRKNNEEVNLPEMINFANILSSTSSRHSILLGESDAKWIKLNPIPNAATIIGEPNSRLDIAVEDLTKLYQRKYITTPPINEDIIIDDKKLNVNLGNFTNPMNNTYGERTGSCMRIMGAGHSLYKFLQENENGFHIRLTDSETGKFISRVSGFRNGNSVFLNELRYSVEPELYSNEEVIKATKQIAQMLIDKSKDSSLPIDNVFITAQYAMQEDKTSQIVNIKENIKEGLPTFYFDLQDKGIILATTSKDKEYVPINTDKINIPRYKVLRDKVKEYTTPEELTAQLNKIHLLNKMITTNNSKIYQECELIPTEQTEEAIYLLSGEDWIAYLDNNLQIHEYYIARDDDRVIQEMKNAYYLLTQKKEEYEQNEATNRNYNRI